MLLAELILDMILLTERQARKGAAVVDFILQYRAKKFIDKRIISKFSSLK